MAKLSGNKDDWTIVITYYTLSRGRHVMMYVLDKNDNYYRVVSNTDAGNTLLVKDGKIKLVDHEEAKTYRKFFEYVKEPQPLVKLPLPESIKGDNYIYYINQKGGQPGSGTR